MVRLGLVLAVLVLSIKGSVTSPLCDLGKILSGDGRVRWGCHAPFFQAMVNTCATDSILNPYETPPFEPYLMPHRWDPKSKVCIPNLCGGANLGDIPDASGYLPSSLACQVHTRHLKTAPQVASLLMPCLQFASELPLCGLERSRQPPSRMPVRCIAQACKVMKGMLGVQMELFDADSARMCLEGKRIVLLGDSTMSETVHDLVLLISGLAHWPDQVDTYVYNATR